MNFEFLNKNWAFNKVCVQMQQIKNCVKSIIIESLEIERKHPKKGGCNPTVQLQSKEKGIKAAYLEEEAVGLLFVKKHQSAIQSYSRSKPVQVFRGNLSRGPRVSELRGFLLRQFVVKVHKTGVASDPKTHGKNWVDFKVTTLFSKLLLLQIHFMSLQSQFSHFWFKSELKLFHFQSIFGQIKFIFVPIWSISSLFQFILRPFLGPFLVNFGSNQIQF